MVGMNTVSFARSRPRTRDLSRVRDLRWADAPRSFRARKKLWMFGYISFFIYRVMKKRYELEREILKGFPRALLSKCEGMLKCEFSKARMQKAWTGGG